MDKNCSRGIGKQISGFIQEASGKVTSETRMVEGALEKATGTTRNVIGGAKGRIREKLND